MLRSATATDVLTQAVLRPPDAARRAGGGTATGPWSSPGPAADSGARSTSSGWTPTTSWRPPGRRSPPARTTPPPGPGGRARPRPRAPDGRRLPARGPRRRRAGRAVRRRSKRAGSEVHLVESAEPSPLCPRHPDRPALHVPRRRPARGAPVPGRALRRGLGPPAPTAARCRSDELGPLDGRGGGRGARPGRAPTAGPRRAARPAALARRVPAGARLGQGGSPTWWPTGRAAELDGRWVPTERRAQAASGSDDDDAAAAECVRGHLELAGPVHGRGAGGRGPPAGGRPRRGAAQAGPGPHRAGPARGRGRRPSSCPTAGGAPGTCWSGCTRPAGRRRRRHVEPASVAELVRFLARWQHVAPGHPARGSRRPAGRRRSSSRGSRSRPGTGRPTVLAGPGAPATTPAGSTSCACRARWPGAGSPPAPSASPRPPPGAGAGRRTPSPATPLALVRREDLPWLLAAVRPGTGRRAPAAGAAADVLDVLRRRRRLLPGRARLRPPAGCRSRSTRACGTWWPGASSPPTPSRPSARCSRPGPGGGPASGARRGPVGLGRAPGGGRERCSARGAGRSCRGSRRRAWAAPPDGPEDPEELAEAVAGQLLARWGVVAWELWARESFRIPWRAGRPGPAPLRGPGPRARWAVRGRAVGRAVRRCPRPPTCWPRSGGAGADGAEARGGRRPTRST